MFRTKDISSRQDVSKYCREVGENFCPFLSPSVDDGVMFFTEYIVDNYSFDELEKFIFYSGLIHTFAFRISRKTETEHKRKLLFCENIIYSINRDIDGERLFAYPHWFLKLLFTEKSILFGKFWKGEMVNSREGSLITVPPVHFFSIRSAIKPVDKRFFTLTPELTQFYLNSEDDDKSVFNFVTDTFTKSILNEIENLNFNTISKERVLQLIDKMLNSELYNEMAKWASNTEKDLGLKNYSSTRIKK